MEEDGIREGYRREYFEGIYEAKRVSSKKQSRRLHVSVGKIASCVIGASTRILFGRTTS